MPETLAHPVMQAILVVAAEVAEAVEAEAISIPEIQAAMVVHQAVTVEQADLQEILRLTQDKSVVSAMVARLALQVTQVLREMLQAMVVQATQVMREPVATQATPVHQEMLAQAATQAIQVQQAILVILVLRVLLVPREIQAQVVLLELQRYSVQQ